MEPRETTRYLVARARGIDNAQAALDGGEAYWVYGDAAAAAAIAQALADQKVPAVEWCGHADLSVPARSR